MSGSQPSVKPALPMEPFREVRSPERNYGPARLPGGTVVTPLARRLAGEAGIDLANVKGSGPHGRIVARDIETARKAPAPAPAQPQALSSLRMSRSAQPLALCAEVTAIELADMIIKAWATALRRACRTPPQTSRLRPTLRVLIRDAASRSLTAIAAARREPVAPADAHGAATAISIANVPGITSVARRAPSAADHDAEHRLAAPRPDRGGGRLGRLRRHDDRDALVRSPVRRRRARRASCFQPSRDLSNSR